MMKVLDPLALTPTKADVRRPHEPEHVLRRTHRPGPSHALESGPAVRRSLRYLRCSCVLRLYCCSSHLTLRPDLPASLFELLLLTLDLRAILDPLTPVSPPALVVSGSLRRQS